jgi:hypothetical protein
MQDHTFRRSRLPLVQARPRGRANLEALLAENFQAVVLRPKRFPFAASQRIVRFSERWQVRNVPTLLLPFCEQVIEQIAASPASADEDNRAIRSKPSQRDSGIPVNDLATDRRAAGFLVVFENIVHDEQIGGAPSQCAVSADGEKASTGDKINAVGARCVLVHFTFWKDFAVPRISERSQNPTAKVHRPIVAVRCVNNASSRIATEKPARKQDAHRQ